MTSKNVTSRPQPRPVNADLVCSHRGEVVVHWSDTVTGPPTAGNITVKQIIDSIAGGSSIWDRAQFSRFDIYGAEQNIYYGTSIPVEGRSWPSMTATINTAAVGGYNGDEPTFYGDAVSNSRRAHVGIRMSSLFSQSWLDTSQTETFIRLVTEPYIENASGETTNRQYTAIIQFTVVLRSTAGVISESVESAVENAFQARLARSAVRDGHQ